MRLYEPRINNEPNLNVIEQISDNLFDNEVANHYLNELRTRDGKGGWFSMITVIYGHTII